MSTPNTSFPSKCPKCMQSTGVVRAAGTVVNEPSIVRLTVRCTTCQHQWAMDKEVATLGSTVADAAANPSMT